MRKTSKFILSTLIMLTMSMPFSYAKTGVKSSAKKTKFFSDVVKQEEPDESLKSKNSERGEDLKSSKNSEKQRNTEHSEEPEDVGISEDSEKPKDLSHSEKSEKSKELRNSKNSEKQEDSESSKDKKNSDDSENIDIPLPNINEKSIDDKPSISIPRHSETKNIYESIIAVPAVICFVLYVFKVLCKNFRIPFDYDPNIKSKHVVYKRAGNPKFKKGDLIWKAVKLKA